MIYSVTVLVCVQSCDSKPPTMPCVSRCNIHISYLYVCSDLSGLLTLLHMRPLRRYTHMFVARVGNYGRAVSPEESIHTFAYWTEGKTFATTAGIKTNLDRCICLICLQGSVRQEDFAQLCHLYKNFTIIITCFDHHSSIPGTILLVRHSFM